MIKNILDFAEVHNRQERKIDGFDPILNYSIGKYVDTPDSYSFKSSYKIKAEIGTIFYACPDEFNEALKGSQINLLRCVYGDILDAIGMIKTDVYGGDKKAVIDGLNKIEEALTRVPK